VTIIVTFIVGMSIEGHREKHIARTAIEYTLSVSDKAYWLVPNLEEFVTLNFQGRKVDTISVVEVAIYNRSIRSFENVTIKLDLGDGTANPIHKLIIYPRETLDKDWVSWLKPNDPSDTTFTLRVLQATEETSPNITLRLFFDTKDLPTVKLKSTSGGLVFEPFSQSPQYWRYFTPERLTQAVVVLFILIIILLIVDYIKRVWQRLIVDAFARVFMLHLTAYSVRNPKTELDANLKQVIKIAVTVLSSSVRRVRLGEASDYRFKLELPGESERNHSEARSQR
jgi:hypothetical protein